MTNTPLKVYSAAVVCQEVPNEISLAIELSGCQHECVGCHSPHLREDVGEPLLPLLESLIEKYDNPNGTISCICFMGGDHNFEELHNALKITKTKGYKTCLYSGCQSIDDLKPVLGLLDYVKTGPYIEAYGGLDSPKTNQRFYINECGCWINTTWLFYK